MKFGPRGSRKMDGTNGILFACSWGPERFAEVFERYVQARAAQGSRRALADDSVAVYRDMWGVFSRYCVACNIDFERIAPGEIESFLDFGAPAQLNSRGRPVPRKPRNPRWSDRYCFRMVSLINALLRFVASANETRFNDAAEIVLGTARFRSVNEDDRDPAPKVISFAMALLIRANIKQAADLAAKADSGGPPLDWRYMRDCATLALHLGAGLTPQEARNLRLDHLYFQDHGNRDVWKIHVVASDGGIAHDVPCSSWVSEALRAWLRVRATILVDLPLATAGSGGDGFVLISDPNGSQISKVRHQKACSALLRAMGVIGDDRGGLFLLRNSFALLQLKHAKHPVESIQRWMGLKRPDPVARFSNVLMEGLDTTKPW